MMSIIALVLLIIGLSFLSIILVVALIRTPNYISCQAIGITALTFLGAAVVKFFSLF